MSRALEKEHAATVRKPLDLPSRNQAGSSAIANTVMEGLSVGLVARDMLKSWAEGKLTDEDLLSFSAGSSPEDPPTHGR
jgi:hypothetical protein